MLPGKLVVAVSVMLAVATLVEREALLREANEAVAAKVRSYYSRRWAPPENFETVVRECGNPACVAGVRLKVGELAAKPVLAPGHGLDVR